MTKFLIAVKFYCNQSTGGEGAELSCGGAKIKVGGLTTKVEGLSPPHPLTLTTEELTQKASTFIFGRTRDLRQPPQSFWYQCCHIQ